MKLTQLNELQMPTWRWLGINAAELDINELPDERWTKPVVSDAPKEVILTEEPTSVEREGLPVDMARISQVVAKHHTYALKVTIPDHTTLSKPLLLDFQLDDEHPQVVESLTILAGEESKGDVIVRYHASGSKVHIHGGFTSMTVKKNASLRLFKVQTLGGRDAHLDGTEATVEENGNVEVVFCELGTAKTVSGCNFLLSGRKSVGTMQTLFLGTGSRHQDFDDRIELRGRDTQGAIIARGALSGTAKKVLRSTLDFIHGAAGSKGSEQETVLTLSDKAVNLSAPLLLSGESNVEGSHAVSSGSPNPQKLFYLMSRGFSELDAKRLLVEASFAPILAALPLPELKETVSQAIREAVHHAN
jgi:Fe-S cluster assembly scaffold protein SufB